VRGLVTAAAVLTLAACSDTHVLSGSFRATAPVTIPGVPGVEGKYLELVLGHYGPDVAGIVWLCADRDCQDRGRCGHLEGGRWSDGVLLFSFPPPGGCQPAPEGQCMVKAKLTLYGDDSLEGTVWLIEEKAQPATLQRKKHSGDVVRDDLECDPEGTTK
jgi:hypothetical protein